MNKPLFSGKIKCLSCDKNYRSKMYRDKRVYVCSGRSNYGVKLCPTSEKIDEEDLIFLIGNSNIHNVKQIFVDENNNVKVVMDDDSELIWNKSKIIR